MRPPRLGVGMRAVPRLCIELCPGIYLTTEENHSKTSVRAAEKCLANHCRARFVWSIWPPTSGGLDWSAGTRRSWFTLRATGPNLGQCKYRPSCRTKGLPTSGNLESKLICLLLRYQGAPVTRQRHLDCSTCSLLTRVRAADLQAG